MKNKGCNNYLLYGIGALGLDLSYGMFYSFLAYYLSSVLGLKEGFLLILTPLARIWDGINDPIMGVVVDNTRTRFGRYKPWLLAGAILNAIVLTLLFTSFGLSGMYLYIYITVMYILWGMTNTMADIPYWSMIPSFTCEEVERNKVVTIARGLSGVGQAIVMILTPIILPILSDGMTTTKGYSAVGFSRWAMICSICLVVLTLVCVLTIKEKNEIISKKIKFCPKEIFKVIRSNDQLLTFMLFAMLSNSAWYLTSGTAIYYFTDVILDSKAQSTFQFAGVLGYAFGLFTITILTKKLNKRDAYSLVLLLEIAGYIGMFFLGEIAKSLILLNFFYFIAAIGTSAMFIAQTIFLADIVDYGEYKNNRRNESVTFSMKGFLQKMAYTIQTMFLFLSLRLVNYNEQIMSHGLNSIAKFTIGLLAFGIPIILITISLIVFRKKFLIYGELSENIRNYILEKRKSQK